MNRADKLCVDKIVAIDELIKIINVFVEIFDFGLELIDIVVDFSDF